MVQRTVEITVRKPHLSMQRGYWMVYACGLEHLDRRALEWVLARDEHA